MSTNATARKIVLAAYRASERDDLDYEFEPSDSGNVVTILQDGKTALAIGDEWETDAEGESQQTGYSWTTWSLPDRTESWDEGGALTEAEARKHVAEWLAMNDRPLPLDRDAVAEPPGQAPWWVLIERQKPPDLAVGPYPTESIANSAMSDSLLIDGFCEEDALDCFVTSTPPGSGVEQVLVDLTNPDHVGP